MKLVTSQPKVALEEDLYLRRAAMDIVVDLNKIDNVGVRDGDYLLNLRIPVDIDNSQSLNKLVEGGFGTISTLASDNTARFGFNDEGIVLMQSYISQARLLGS